jgi:transcriptional regulator
MMYTPAHFHETDAAAIEALIEAFPLAALVAQTPEGLVANHLPLLRERDALVGHIALANDLHRLLDEGAEVLAIFRGEDRYISPNWYPTKAETHKAVPTWNYQVVHVHGRISFQHDRKTKLAVVGRLTKRHEEAENGTAGWRMADAPKDYLDMMLDNIVAFRIEIARVQAKSKLNQNRADADFNAVAEQMAGCGKVGLAARMKELGKNR